MFAASPLHTALCAAESSAESAALCFALTDGDAAVAADATAAPQWRELIPAPNAEGKVVGVDGRWWRMSDPQAVAAAYNLALPVDVNHASEIQAPKGGEAPAYGWVEALEVRQGGIWGRIAWNTEGRKAITAKQYRYLSPAFEFAKNTLEIARVTSVGLVNQPNFPIALNRASEQELPIVDKAIREALGLTEAATPEQAVIAINSIKQSSNSATPPLDKFVPRGDYDTALNRATTAETALRERDQANHKAAVDAEIDAALKTGKITPATVDYHRASCAAEGGLDRFKAFVTAAPAVADPTNLDNRQANTDGKALNAATKAVAAMFGNSAEDVAKTIAAQETA